MADFQLNPYLGGYASLLGGMGGLDEKSQQMIRNQLLMSAGAQLLGGSAAGEKTGTSFAKAAMTGLDTVDSMLGQGLKAQMLNRDMQQKESRTDALLGQDRDNIKAANDYLTRAKKRGPLTDQDYLTANAIRNGYAGSIASSMMRNPFGMFGMGGNTTQAPDMPNRPELPGFNPNKPIDIGFMEGAGAVLRGINPLQPGGTGKAGGYLDQFGNWIMDKAKAGYDAYKGYPTPKQNAAAQKFPAYEDVPSGLPENVRRNLYDVIAEGGEEAFKRNRATMTPAQREYVIDLLTWGK